MDIKSLKAGASLWLEDGSVVEVVEPSADGKSVRVRYVEAPFDEALTGTETTCTDYEIVGFGDNQDRADSASAG